MCDLVEAGVAYDGIGHVPPSRATPPDIATYAQQITAGRGLVAAVEAGPETVTVHIPRPPESRRDGRWMTS